MSSCCQVCGADLYEGRCQQCEEHEYEQKIADDERGEEVES
jgi:hypothetical protein